MQETWVWSLGQERPPGGGNVLYLQHSCLGNPMDGGAWWAAVHGVAKSWTRLSYFPFTFHFHALEKEMATHSSVLAWRIPGTGEPGGLLSMGSHRVGHDWSDLAASIHNDRLTLMKGKIFCMEKLRDWLQKLTSWKSKHQTVFSLITLGASLVAQW